MSSTPEVTLVRIELVVNGQRREMLFVRQEKIAELLQAESSLGSFLRGFRDFDPAASSALVQ